MLIIITLIEMAGRGGLTAQVPTPEETEEPTSTSTPTDGPTPTPTWELVTPPPGYEWRPDYAALLTKVLVPPDRLYSNMTKYPELIFLPTSTDDPTPTPTATTYA